MFDKTSTANSDDVDNCTIPIAARNRIERKSNGQGDKVPSRAVGTVFV